MKLPRLFNPLLVLLSGVSTGLFGSRPATPARPVSGHAAGLVAHVRATRGRHAPRPSPAPVGTGGWAGPPMAALGAAADAGERADAWRRARPQMAGTYLPDIVTQGGDWVRRWEDRDTVPVRVWIAPGDSVAGWRPSFGRTVRAAFASWEQVGLPLRFVVVDAPDDAEVRVTWTAHLDAQRAGVTHWTADADGWLTQARIVLATWASDGSRADDASIRRIALHEIGHAIGLEHSANPADVMAPWVQTGDLTARDRTTLHLLYALPPGAVPADASGVPSAPAVPTDTAAAHH